MFLKFCAFLGGFIAVRQWRMAGAAVGVSAPAQLRSELLEQFLKFCDFPKFAQLDPSEEECRRLHGIAVKLVQETAPAQPGSAPPQIVPPKIN